MALCLCHDQRLAIMLALHSCCPVAHTHSSFDCVQSSARTCISSIVPYVTHRRFLLFVHCRPLTCHSRLANVPAAVHMKIRQTPAVAQGGVSTSSGGLDVHGRVIVTNDRRTLPCSSHPADPRQLRMTRRRGRTAEADVECTKVPMVEPGAVVVVDFEQDLCQKQDGRHAHHHLQQADEQLRRRDRGTCERKCDCECEREEVLQWGMVNEAGPPTGW